MITATAGLIQQTAPHAHIGEVKLLCDVSVYNHQAVTLTSQQPILCSTSSQTDITFISPFSINQIANDKKCVHFYTGFDDYDTLVICYEFLGPCVHHLQWHHTMWYNQLCIKIVRC